MAPDERAAGVLAYSSGNHAQGIAMAARGHGIPAVIVMPNDAPRMKIENTRALGAEVVLYDRPGGESREDVGARLIAERGLSLIQPYDHPQVIAGQGTTGLEIAAQAAEAGIDRADVLVCCGGGGLSSGIALALEAEAPGLRVRTCEPEGFDDVARSLAAGERLENGLVVSDEECLAAMAQAFARLKIVLEPGGAAALAAALLRRDDIAGDDVIVVATGGNVDAEVFVRALSQAE